MNITPKKSLGQHFLTDRNIIKKIAGAVTAPEDHCVIELGAGTGALTGALIERFNEVQAVEIDTRAAEVLQEQYPRLPIHCRDMLAIDWSSLSAGKRKTHVVGNLPYNITSPVLFMLLENRRLLADAVIMMQREVAERLTADIRTKDYGILSVQTQLMSSPEALFPVSRRCFSPPPRVESMVVRLVFDKDELGCSDGQLKTVVRTAFNQRRKKLSNALERVASKKDQPDGFDFSKRAEAWPPQEYEKLTIQLTENGILT
jgi:16S rRNA (adenine1518-N6/adenine1519-N6)-dimethyltransferase